MLTDVPIPLERALPILDRVLSDMAEADRLPFLAHLEQKAWQESDLFAIRMFKEYRAKHNL